MTNKMQFLKDRQTKLEADKRAVEDQISQVKREIEAIQLAAYPHKVGDVIEGRRGQPVKIVRIAVALDGAFPIVVEKLPSGGWSKREKFQIDWERVFSEHEKESNMRTDGKELEILRVSLARIAQACGPAVEREIPGAEGRTELEFTELSRLARELDRGWNRLAAFIVDAVANPSLADLDAKLAEFP